MLEEIIIGTCGSAVGAIASLILSCLYYRRRLKQASERWSNQESEIRLSDCGLLSKALGDRHYIQGSLTWPFLIKRVEELVVMSHVHKPWLRELGDKTFDEVMIKARAYERLANILIPGKRYVNYLLEIRGVTQEAEDWRNRLQT